MPASLPFLSVQRRSSLRRPARAATFAPGMLFLRGMEEAELEQLKALSLGGKSITNRAVGLIEREQLCLLKEAEENCRAAWNSYAAFCLQDEKLNKMPSAWQARWKQQMQNFSASFSIYAVADTADLNNLPGSIQNIIDQMERRKDSRLFKQWRGSDMPKCTQCGHREILSGKEDSFWKNIQTIIRVKDGRELLCACCLAKRIFAFCDIFQQWTLPLRRFWRNSASWRKRIRRVFNLSWNAGVMMCSSMFPVSCAANLSLMTHG